MKKSIVRQRLTSPRTPISQVTTKPPSPSRSNTSFTSVGFSDSMPTKPNSTVKGYIRQRRPSGSFRQNERGLINSTVNSLKAETAYFNKDFKTTQHAIRRLEEEEWQRVKKLQSSRQSKEEKEHMEYNKVVDLQFKNLQAKQHKLEELLRRSDKEKEIQETRTIKLKRKEIEEKEHSDFLLRESLKSQFSNRIKDDRKSLQKLEREENRRRFGEEIKIKKETKCQCERNEKKEIEYRAVAKATGEWKVARARSQQSLMDLRRLQKLLEN